MTSWKHLLQSIPSVESKSKEDFFNPLHPWPANRVVYFIVTPLRMRHDDGRIGAPISIVCRDIKKDGTKTIPLHRPITPRVTITIPNEADRNLLSRIASNRILYGYGLKDCSRFLLDPANYDHFLPLLCATKRCFIEPVQQRYHLYTIEGSPPLEIDDGPPWSLAIQWESQGNDLMAKVDITRHSEIIGFEEIQAIYPGDESNHGILIHNNLISHYLFQPTLFLWIQLFMRRKSLKVPRSKWGSIV